MFRLLPPFLSFLTFLAVLLRSTTWSFTTHRVRYRSYLPSSICHTPIPTFALSDSNEGKDFLHPKSSPKLDYDECYYKVLEVDPIVDLKELKRAYYKVVFKYHPDNKVDITETEKELCNKQMMVINGAYRVLKNSLTRTEYNKKRALGLYGAKAGVKGSGTNDSRYTNKAASAYRSASTPEQRPPVPEEQSAEQRVVEEKEKPPPQPSARDFTTSDVPPRRSKSVTASRFWEEMKEREDFQTAASSDYEEAEEYFNFQDIYNDLDESTRRYAASRAGAAGHPRNRPGARAYKPPGEFDDEGNEIIRSRGDGSIKSLKAYLRSLIRQKNKLENKLLSDERDWGEVQNMDMVRGRLRDIEEVRHMSLLVADLEDEIENKTYYQAGTAYDGDEWKRGNSRDIFTRDPRARWGGGRGDDADQSIYNPYNEPQPQSDPRWQDEPPSRGGSGDTGGGRPGKTTIVDPPPGRRRRGPRSAVPNWDILGTEDNRGNKGIRDSRDNRDIRDIRDIFKGTLYERDLRGDTGHRI